MTEKSERLDALQQLVINCERCPRLVEWRTRVAREKVRRYQDEVYWGRPVPSFGDAEAQLLIVGLAPAAHGGNRTGRVFTGDRSGDWLYRALFKAGFANQPTSIHRGDGLRLKDCYITAVIHCAPPDNKPLPDEVSNCRPYLLTEIESLDTVKVVVALGGIAFDAVLAAFKALGSSTAPGGKSRKPRFGHGVEHPLTGSITLIASFHPSQQNTFTGRLTEPMFDSIFTRARSIIETGSRRDLE